MRYGPVFVGVRFIPRFYALVCAAAVQEEVHSLREDVLAANTKLQRSKQELLLALQEKAEIVAVLAEQLAGTSNDVTQQAALMDAQRKALTLRAQQIEEWEDEANETRKALMIIDQHVKQGLVAVPLGFGSACVVS